MEVIHTLLLYLFGSIQGIGVASLTLPFFAFVFLMIAKPTKLSHQISIGFMLSCFVAALFFLFETTNGSVIYLSSSWVSIGNSKLDIVFVLDGIAALMLAMVSFITLMVMIFSIEYMRGEKRYSYYFAYINLFAFAMFGLILSGNLFWTYIFWEMVGFCSYLLIGFYTQKQSAIFANKKAFIINRIGDLGFLVGMMILLNSFGTLTTSELFNLITERGAFVSESDAVLLHYAGYAFFIAVIAKSAQFPLHVWLPDAMEGPTPVSALIHAATMVISGIYLLIRIFFLIDPSVLNLIAVVGSFTAFIGAFIAGRQFDIKKILAYSTISQLGYMVTAIGVGAPMAAFYHLYTHAFFKAALFLGAGSIIHVLHTQDIRQMGGLRKILPITFIVYSIASAALIGIPFFSGFFSKENILNEIWHWSQMHGQYYIIVPFFAFSSVAMTAFYVFRHLSLVFFGTSRNETNMTKQKFVVNLPLILLAAGSVYMYPLYHASHAYTYMPVLTLLLIALGMTLAYLICYRKYIKPFSERHIIYKLSSQALYLDKIYEWIFIKPIHYMLNKLQPVDYKFDKDIIHGMGNAVIYFSHFVQFFELKVIDAVVNAIAVIGIQLAHLVAWFDKWIVDGIVNAVALLSRRVGDFIRAFQTGKIQSYFAMSALLLVFIIWYFIKEL